MNLNRFDILLDNKLFITGLYLFFVFLFCFFFSFLFFFFCGCWEAKITNASSSSLRSFHIIRKEKCSKSKQVPDLFCFSSAIDENTETVHLILNRYLFVEKRQEKLKTQVRDASYELESKLVVICRNIQHITERYYNEQSCWESPYKRVLWNLIYLINYLEEIKNVTWLSNAYISDTKNTFP